MKLYRNYSINNEIFERLTARLKDHPNAQSLSYKDFVDLTLDETQWNKLRGYYVSFESKSNEVYFLLPGYLINAIYGYEDEKINKTFIGSYYYILHYDNRDNDKKLTTDITGNDAFRNVMRILKQTCHYNDTEIDHIINQFGIQEEQKPLHEGLFYDLRFLMFSQNKVIKIDNCEYYDLNKAYASCLMKFFPRAAEVIKAGYKSKDPDKKALWKKTINYAVGFFQRNKFKPLRNAIVKFINNEINKAIDYCDGELIYLNTDGFIIKNAKNKLKTSANLGEFKEEQIDNNTIYFLKNMDSRTKYSLFEYYENGTKKHTIIGGFRKTKDLYNCTNLKENKYPDIKITRDPLGFEDIDIEEN